MQNEQLINQSLSAFSEAQSKVSVILKNTETATLKLSQVVSVTNEDEDEKAKAVLVECRSLMNGVEADRKSITTHLDNIKTNLMLPEKAIKAEYDRVKDLRDKFAQEKARIEAEKKRIAQIAFERENNLAELETTLKTSIYQGLQTSISNGGAFLTKLFNTITDQESANKFIRTATTAYTHGMKAETYQAWLSVQLPKHCTAQDLEAKIAELPSEYSLEYSNNQLKEAIKVHAVDLIDKVPEKLAEVKRLAELEAKNKAAAEAERKRLAEQQAKEAEVKRMADELKAEQERQAQAKKLQEEEEQKKLEASFNHSMATQSIATVAGRTTKVATIKYNDSNEFHDNAIMIISACLTHPDFKAFKLDVNGEPELDKNGRPIYTEGLEYFLKFYALKIGESSEAVEISNIVSSVARK